MAGNPKLLAGSAQPQIWGVNHLIKRGICDVATAIDLASVNPATLMDLPQRKGISEGAPADFILFTQNASGSIELLDTCKRGEMTP
jgi:N-acetylglucosamine-6-phosphate deacetylase